jgi:predicted N-acyltransferase
MDGDTEGGISVSIVDGLSRVDRAAWDAIANPVDATFDPFLCWDFLQGLEEAGCVGARSGWTARHVLAHRHGVLAAAMPLYVKAHSYGEYVFDHSWADALHRVGGRYYPKLQAAVPFTPVTGRRLLGDARLAPTLLAGAETLAEEIGASSIHVTFATAAQTDAIIAQGFLRRAGVQFHWFNRGYGSFAAFLDALSANKRKTIRRERERAHEGLSIATLQGDAITAATLDAVFACYMDTGARKWGSPYLNRAFFDLLAARMADRLVVMLANIDGKPAAMALNLLGSDCLYGRYWGRLVDVPFLHFELCYYRAIDFAIAHSLARVEAGAQGEHKLLRGYEPVATHSAHWIAHPGLRAAVADFLAHETPAVAREIEHLDEHTPFKKHID